MNRLKMAAAMGCIAIAGAVLAPVLRADGYERKSFLTFTNPFEIPGVHLAGWGGLPVVTYVSSGFWIRSLTGTHPSEALRAWFYPGRNWGEEFVYPKVTINAIQTGEKVQLAQVATPPAAETLLARAKEPTTHALPSTASPMPLLFWLLGLPTLGGTLAVRAVASRIAR